MANSEWKDASDEVCRVGIKVPPFWPNEPALWFVQLEAQFALSNITVDATKFYYVISNLDVKYVCEVKDVITNPPEDKKYEKIKSELISRLSASREQRVRQLLSHEELGDRKPSQFLRHLRNLAGSDVPDDFIRSLWTSRLPSHIQAIVAAQIDLPLDSLAQVVDKIYEIALQPSVAEASTSKDISAAQGQSSAIEQLTRRVDDLCRHVAELSSGSRARSKSRSPSPHWRRRSRSRSQTDSRLSQRPVNHPYCWYHWTYGPRAKKCSKPCDYGESENSQGSRN